MVAKTHSPAATGDQAVHAAEKYIRTLFIGHGKWFTSLRYGIYCGNRRHGGRFHYGWGCLYGSFWGGHFSGYVRTLIFWINDRPPGKKHNEKSSSLCDACNGYPPHSPGAQSEYSLYQSLYSRPIRNRGTLSLKALTIRC